MAYDQIVKKAANNSYIAEVMMRSPTTGMGLTGLAYGDVTYGYWREGAATGANGTCVTMSKGTYADHGWVEVDSTNLPGVYQFGVPDAALATGANAATVILKATGAIDARLRIVLVDVDLRDSVRLGMTALPNAAADAAGGLPISDDGGLDLDAILEDTDNLQSNQGNWLTATGFSTHSAADVWAVGTRTLTSFGTLAADAATAVWAAGARTLTAISDSSGITTLLSRIVGTLDTGTHKPQSGDAYSVVNNGTYGNSALKTLMDDLPTNSELGTALGAADDDVLAAIAALNDLDSAGAQAAAEAALAAYGAALESTLTDIKGATWTDETLEAIKAAVDALEAGTAPTVEEIDEQLSRTHGSGAWGGAVGAGGTEYQWPEAGAPLDDGTNPVDGAAVWICADEAGTNIVAGPQFTQLTGYVPALWMLESGTEESPITYYVKCQKAGITFPTFSFTIP